MDARAGAGRPAHSEDEQPLCVPAFLTMRRILVSIAAANGQRRRRIPTSCISNRSFAEITAEAKSFFLSLLPLLLSEISKAAGKRRPRRYFAEPGNDNPCPGRIDREHENGLAFMHAIVLAGNVPRSCIDR
jgi:hypothetical protein